MQGYFNVSTLMPLEKLLSDALIDVGYFPDRERAEFSDAHLQLAPKFCALLEEKQRLSKLLSDEFSAYPETFCLTGSNTAGLDAWLDSQSTLRFIIKPALLNNGDGIVLCQNAQEVIRYFRAQPMTGPLVIQRYIEPPMLLDGAKFSQRLFLVMTNFAGGYLYSQGYYNRCLAPYTDFLGDNLAAQLSNEHLASAGALSNTEQIHSEKLPEFAVDFKMYQPLISEVLKRASVSLPEADAKARAFSVFGVDFMRDAAGEPWLLEFNHCPCFPTSTLHPLYASLYQPLFRDIVKAFVPACIHRERNVSLEGTGFIALG